MILDFLAFLFVALACFLGGFIVVHDYREHRKFMRDMADLQQYAERLRRK